MPVLPEVGSTSTEWPGSMSRSASASSIMYLPMRSFTEPPGLRDSSLTATDADRPAPRRFRRTMGVEPIVSSMAVLIAGMAPPSGGRILVQAESIPLGALHQEGETH